MKKIISFLLVFAVVASLMSVCGFAADAETATNFNGIFDEITSAFAEFVAPLVDEYNCGSSDLIFDTGINDFVASIEDFFESICIGLIDLVATVEALFS